MFNADSALLNFAETVESALGLYSNYYSAFLTLALKNISFSSQLELWTRLVLLNCLNALNALW